MYLLVLQVIFNTIFTKMHGASLASSGLINGIQRNAKAQRGRKMSKVVPVNSSYQANHHSAALEKWLDFPVDQHQPVFFNSIKVWLIWLLWTNKSMAALIIPYVTEN